MKKELLTSSVIHADETVVQVLNESGRKAKTDSRMWVYAEFEGTWTQNKRPTGSGLSFAYYLTGCT